jgi:hypothetical protein
LHCGVECPINAFVAIGSVSALGPGPVLLLVFVLPFFAWDDTQIWLGDLHVVWLGVVFVFVCIATVFFELYRCDLDLQVRYLPCLTVYPAFRTEPLSYIGRTRGKKTRASPVKRVQLALIL